jgi:hypothetical protein
MENFDLKTDLYTSRLLELKSKKYVDPYEVRQLIKRIQEDAIKQIKDRILQCMIESLNNNLSLDEAIIKINLTT